MTDDDLADALSSDFTCTTVPSAGEKEVRPKEVLVLLSFKGILLSLKYPFRKKVLIHCFNNNNTFNTLLLIL